MKKTLIILGGFFGVIILVAVVSLGGLLIYGSIYGPSLDKESKTWVDTTIPKIVSLWDANEAEANMSPKLLQTTSPSTIQSLFSRFSTILGPIKKYNGSTGQSGIHLHNFQFYITGDYVSDVSFEKGDAEIDTQTLKVGNSWKLIYFYVNISSTTPGQSK
jgi:hypothetical protein